MKVTRSEFVGGFQLLGFIGLLVGAFVVPGQWVSGAVRPEAAVGIAVSAVCVIAAALLARSIKPAVIVTAELLLFVGAGYFALTPFIAADVGWQHWQRIGLLAAASAAAAFVGWCGLRHLRHVAPNKSLNTDAPKDGAPVS